jgi:hypothetical protein
MSPPRGGGASWAHGPPWIASVPAGILLLFWTALTLASPGPTVLLFGARLEQARSLAVDSALARGWRLVATAAESVTFEQTLEEDPEEDAAGPSRVIRVLARFGEEADGVRIELSAHEVESPGLAGEWSADVTDRYGLNLANALSSLRARWDTHRSAPPVPWSHEAPIGRGQAPPSSYPDAAPGSVGTWAYYAEQYARSRGCVLADSGATLESAGAEWERHRVPCQDGSWVHVYCRFGDCTAAPP